MKTCSAIFPITQAFNEILVEKNSLTDGLMVLPASACADGACVIAITFGCATCIHVLMLALVLVLVGRLGSANQPFCAHKAECQTHTKDLLGWVCIFLGGGDGEKRLHLGEWGLGRLNGERAGMVSWGGEVLIWQVRLDLVHPPGFVSIC